MGKEAKKGRSLFSGKRSSFLLGGGGGSDLACKVLEGSVQYVAQENHSGLLFAKKADLR